jgi:hypothetical protein
MNRSQYQQDPAQPGIVSVSRRAGLPVAGSRVASQDFARASGAEPSAEGLKSSIGGSSTGRSPSGTATTLPSSRWSSGNGSPQYRCRLNSQSRSLYVTFAEPRPFSESQRIVFAFASATPRPSSHPLFTARPSPRYGPSSQSGGGSTVRTIGRS